MKGIITVVGKDKVGIIAKICIFLGDNGINILDISQTIVSDYLNMMMIVDFTLCNKKVDIVVEEIRELGISLGFDIRLQREDIFNNMHRI